MDAGTFWTFFLVGLAVFNSPFAIGVYRDAKARGALFVTPQAWAAVTLIGGVLVAVLYWLMHMSRLAQQEDRAHDRSGAA